MHCAEKKTLQSEQKIVQNYTRYLSLHIYDLLTTICVAGFTKQLFVIIPVNKDVWECG